MTELHQSAPAFMEERELLLQCAACDGDKAIRVQFSRIAARNLDWKWVLSTAESHGVLPMLRSRLEQLCPSVVPAPVSSHLLAGCVANAARNLRMTGELLALLRSLEESGIGAVPFKGPALANQLYGNVAMRQFRDLDILVHPSDVERAKRVLISRGYRPEFELTGARETEYLRSEHAYQFTKEKGGFIIELHWSFGSRDQAFPLSAENVWSRLRRATLQGRTVNALSNEDLLIYLCMHGAKHQWHRLEWISSLAQLIRLEPDLDWGIVFSRAQRSGALRGVRLGLLLANDICAAPLPPAVKDRTLVDPVAQALAWQVRAGLFANGTHQQSSELRRQAFYLKTRERFSDRARIVLFYWVRIPHPHSKDWELFHLPASLSFLYYFLRPLRLLREHGLRLLRATPGSGDPVTKHWSGLRDFLRRQNSL